MQQIFFFTATQLIKTLATLFCDNQCTRIIVQYINSFLFYTSLPTKHHCCVQQPSWLCFFVARERGGPNHSRHGTIAPIDHSARQSSCEQAPEASHRSCCDHRQRQASSYRITPACRADYTRATTIDRSGCTR